MSGDDHLEQPGEDSIIVDAEFVDVDAVEAGSFDAGPGDIRPAGMALIPIAEPAQWSQIRPRPRPNSIFLTHLIATRERASASDANAAYTASRHRISGAGLRARQIV